ncbi:hypothetical protein IE53DRAFT_387852 [Violaceomyces palustris]|uniref:Uncharacterized protein n=1 Tax=Violaceomyces palustris TaxID=1673888 RepID=A0ACD0NVS9_9BASI|nr:hypothetical protein IE53DRAFT_387852 [Violaceomyces palustris]
MKPRVANTLSPSGFCSFPSPCLGRRHTFLRRLTTASPASPARTLQPSRSGTAQHFATPRHPPLLLLNPNSSSRNLFRGLESHTSSSLRRGLTTLSRRPENPEDESVLSDGDPSINLTDRAVEQLRKVAEKEKNPDLSLRIAVEPGGCHGYQYKLELTEEAEEDDFHFTAEHGVKVLVDSVSLALVKGSTIDYVTELIGSQFAIKNNPQAKGAGCGCGVSWEPAI